MLEDMFKEDSDDISNSWKTEADEEEDNGPESSLPPGFEDVQPRGYDHDFWDPLIEKHLGGSDAEQVMASIDVPKTAPHIIHCTTGDAFDHTVLPSGEQPTKWKPDPEDPTSHHHSFPHVYPNPMDTCTPQSVPSTSVHHRKYPHGQSTTSSAGVHQRPNPHGHPTTFPTGVHQPINPHVHSSMSTRTPPSRSNISSQVPPSTLPGFETRPLSEISDEEFDVPPLFDDLFYEAEDVPDLLWEDNNEEPFVGKLYASKHDCQIALAIYQSRSSSTSGKPESLGIPLCLVAMILDAIGAY